MKETYIIGGIEAEIIRKKCKNLYLRIYPDGRAVLTAPATASEKRIADFASAKADWLRKHIPKEPVKPKSYGEGEELFILGQPYAIKLSANCKKALVSEGFVIFPENITKDLREELYYGLLKEYLRSTVEKMTLSCTAKVGKSPVNVRYRKMKSRWGSCNVKTGYITLNTELGKYPASCAEFVLIHELCHLHEPSHNKRFKTLLASYCPDHRIHENVLKNYSCE